jgi:hypothetical protein
MMMVKMHVVYIIIIVLLSFNEKAYMYFVDIFSLLSLF